MAVREILLLGNPKLYEISEPVEEKELESLSPIVEDLHDTMAEFKRKFGAGRAIAAPQIDVMKRLIYMFIDAPTVFINPILEFSDTEMIVVWDDCMSFPDLLVKVQRHRHCTIRYKDMQWQDRTVELVDDLSELLQHEYDHLDGILAVSRAIDGKSFALKSQREE